MNNIKTKNEKIRTNQIVSGPIRQEVLPKGFIIRVIIFKELLKEVEETSLEETISNFQRDSNPMNELKIWEEIASIYTTFVKDGKTWTLKQKKDIFSKILTRTLIK